MLFIHIFMSFIICFFAIKTIYAIQKERIVSKKIILLCCIGHVLLLEMTKTYSLVFYVLCYLLFYMSVVDAYLFCFPTVSLVGMFVCILMLCVKTSHIYLCTRVFSSVLGCLPVLLLKFIKRNSIGDGDLYFLLILGLYIGQKAILQVTFMAYCMALLQGVVLSLQKSEKIAMIPYLYISTLLYFSFPFLG